MPDRTFTKDFLVDELDLPDNDDIVVSSELIDTSRWSIHYSLVFKYEDKYYRAHYSVGATESQDEGPWEFEDEVTCEEVESKEVTVTTWIPVKDDEFNLNQESE